LLHLIISLVYTSFEIFIEYIYFFIFLIIYLRTTLSEWNSTYNLVYIVDDSSLDCGYFAILTILFQIHLNKKRLLSYITFAHDVNVKYILYISKNWIRGYIFLKSVYT
jgi:hypothetical protein